MVEICIYRAKVLLLMLVERTDFYSCRDKRLLENRAAELLLLQFVPVRGLLSLEIRA